MKSRSRWAFSVSLMGMALVAGAQTPPSSPALLAPTPPMGWNSWDSYGLTVTEPEFKANAQWLAKNLERYGWKYVVVDEGWYLENPESKGKAAFHYTLSDDGRYLPAVNRFPSAANHQGFRPLADSVHALGLKFGIHIIRGIPREAVRKNLPIDHSAYHAAAAADESDLCSWNSDNYGVKPSPAGQAYYDSLVRLYAGWGVDFIKVDCISSPYKAEEIRMIGLAIKRSGRPIVLSLSPGPTPLEEAATVRQSAQMWRISGDFWDHWALWPDHPWSQSLQGQFSTLAQWAPHVEPGHWPDADMLPIGDLGPRPGAGAARSTRLTRDEQRTLLTLWSIARSPLMMGGDLPSNDPWTTSLLTNAEVIAVDQHSKAGRPVVTAVDTVIWTAQAGDGRSRYVAVFNVGESRQRIQRAWKDLGLHEVRYQVRDLWEHADMGPAKSLDVTLAPHASLLYRLQ